MMWNKSSDCPPPKDRNIIALRLGIHGRWYVEIARNSDNKWQEYPHSPSIAPRICYDLPDYWCELPEELK